MEELTRNIERDCPMCGNKYLLRISEMRYDQYKKYVVYHSRELIQKALPDFDKFEREFIKTGYCPKCQKKIFSAKLPKDDSEKWICCLDVLSVEEFNSFLDDCNEKDVFFIDALSAGEWKDKLSAPQKVVIISESALEGDYYVNNDGEVKAIEE